MSCLLYQKFKKIFFKLFIYLNWSIIKILWWVLPYINMNRHTCILSIPPHSLPPGCHRALVLGALCHTSNSYWSSILHMVKNISSVQSLSRVRLFATPWATARQASLSIINSQSSPKLMSIESVMPSSHLILRRPLLLLPSAFPSIRVFSNESALHIRWPNAIDKIF